MLNQDPLYRFVGSHSLPVSRGVKPVYNFLKEYFEEFINGLENCCLTSTKSRTLSDAIYRELASKMSEIKLICQLLIDYLKAHDAGLEKQKNKIFDVLMKNVSPFLPKKILTHNPCDRFHKYYRLRSGKIDKKTDLFHIPWSKRSRIGAYRYSIPGQPCLYLATGLELCFFECGMPSEFSTSIFKLDIPEGEELRFVDFSIDTYNIITNVELWLKNRQYGQTQTVKYLINYLISFPLRMACSMSVADRSAKFVEEYIIPQQLMKWIVENKKYDGILYRTCSANEIARRWQYVNLAMPAVEIENEYSSKLMEMFSVSNPVYVNVPDKIDSAQYKLDTVYETIEKINIAYLNGHALQLYLPIEDVCRAFVHAITTLKSDNYKNPELLNLSLSAFSKSSLSIIDACDVLKEKSLKQYEYFDSSRKKMVGDECDEILRVFKEAAKVMLMHASYESVVCGNIEYDKNSLSHITI